MGQLADFRAFLADAKSSDHVQVWMEPTVVEIVDSGKFSLKQFKYRIEDGVGYVHYVFVPRWMKDAMMMYHTYKYYDMTVVEFLETMSP